ncbi:MAG: 50S ribosomal protein L11 [Candidatus Aenigmatarchaeota archaeon]
MAKKEKVQAMVEGGKATAGPPLGPALGPLGVPIKKIIEEINEKTKELQGMQVPVTIIVDTATKVYEIKIGTPPVSALIKKELKLEKGSSEPGRARAGDLTMEQVRKIAITKFGSDDERYVTQVIGVARSMGVTIEKGPLTKEEIKAYEEARKRALESKATAVAGMAGTGTTSGEAK